MHENERKSISYQWLRISLALTQRLEIEAAVYNITFRTREESSKTRILRKVGSLFICPSILRLWGTPLRF